MRYQDTVTSESAIIAVDKLVKRYKRAETNAVDGVSFVVKPGELFALLGPNGAGKTTTLSILTTTLAPSAGSVEVCGHDVARESAAVRRQVGIIFQRPSLDLNLTGEENVRFHMILYGLYPFRPTFSTMPHAYQERVRELAEVVGIAGERFRPTQTRSGGMRRKLEIVRGLMHRPRVLFLDEPTTGLDTASRYALWEYLRTVRRETGTTVFLTTHYLDEAEEADTICIVAKGRVVAFGPPDRLKAELTAEALEIDAHDRAALWGELTSLGVVFQGDGPFHLSVGGAGVHELLRRIETPLTMVRTQAPSLEDVYLKIVADAE